MVSADLLRKPCFLTVPYPEKVSQCVIGFMYAFIIYYRKSVVNRHFP